MGAPPLPPVRCIATLAAATTGADLAAAPPSHSHQTPVPVCATGADPHTFSEPNSHHPLGGASSPPAGPTALSTLVQPPMGSVPQINRVPCSQPDATGGEPSELAHQFSPQSLDSLLHHVQYVASVWPAYGDLRSAATANKRSRLRTVFSAMVCEARLVFAASYFLACSGDPLRLPPACSAGEILHSWALSLLVHGPTLLGLHWRWTDTQISLLRSQLSCLVSAQLWSAEPVSELPVDPDALQWSAPARPYPAALIIFLHSLRVGAPWTSALSLFANMPHGFFSRDGRFFAFPTYATPGGAPDRCVPLAAAEDSEALTLFFNASGLVAVASSHSLLPRLPPTPTSGLVHSRRGCTFQSRFLPSYIKLTKIPSRDVMSIYRSAHMWHKRLGPLDATCTAIVEGRLHMSKPRLTLRPSRRSNHASWERNEAAKIALGPKFATWTWQGIVEMVPSNCPLPLFIEPLGAVDKATAPWWRLILDARLSNAFQDPWGVWYFSVAQLAALLDVCDIMFAEDLEDAYHLSIFSGCTGKPMWSRTFALDEHGQVVERWRLVMGCDVYSCLGLCDKAMSGFCIDGFVGRFAAAHFGQRNAGSPLNVLMRAIQRFLARRAPSQPRLHTSRAPAPASTPAPLALVPCTPRGLHSSALHSAVWVDDAVYVTKTAPHPPCAGLRGGCFTCLRYARSARRSQASWHTLAAELGLGLSDDKRQLPSQRVTYTGMVVDTFRRTLSIPPEKKVKLVAFLEEFFDCREATLSQLASLRGRVQHYSACLPYISVFVALFSSVIGCEQDPDYERTVSVPPAINEAAVFIREVLEEHAFSGRPLWPFVPSSLYAAFLAGETGDARIVVLSWDASLHGWGLVLRWWANREGKVIVGSLPAGDDMQHQIRRETCAGVLSLEAADLEVDLSGATIIFRNDAVGALAALRKGSFASSFLQTCALRANRCLRRRRATLLTLHAPGKVLLQEGVDGYSRDGAREVTGPVSSAKVRRLATQLAAQCGWSLTVDAFATEANAFLPRFFARYAEPKAEAEDAFTVLDWARSSCPHCGSLHREYLFAFPPPPLLNKVVAKARADGACAILITPLSVAAPYWNKLLRASILQGEEPYLRVRRQALSGYLGSDTDGDLAIFAVDFSPFSLRVHATPALPSCGRAAEFRGRDPAGSPHDLRERARIHDALAAVGLALRA